MMVLEPRWRTALKACSKATWLLVATLLCAAAAVPGAHGLSVTSPKLKAFCASKSVYGRYSPPNGDCYDYVICSNGKPFLTERCPPCPEGTYCNRLVFDEASERCVLPPARCARRCLPDCLSAAATKATQHLLVWAGPTNTKKCRDAVVVVDATPGSPGFGSVVAVTEVPFHGTEPHHVGLSADGQILGAGGLLAVLSGSPDLFFLNVSNPLRPRYIKSLDPPKSAVPDEFVALPGGGFLVTMMGAADGSHPGRVAKIRPDLTLEGEYPARPPNGVSSPPFNPHGIAVDFKRQRMVTVDYLNPASTLLPTDGPQLRHTARVWDLKTMTILHTFDAGVDGANGLMDARMIGDTGVAALTSGKGGVWGIHVLTYKTKVIHRVASKTNHCLMQLMHDGTRALLSVFGLDLVQLVDTSNPWSWQLLQEHYLPAGSGPHYITASSDERMAAVSTYFLDEPKDKGVVHAGGTRQVYYFDIDASGNSFAPHPIPFTDFKGAVGEFTGHPKCGAYRPHGMAWKQTA